MFMAVTGNNGDNETNVELSRSVSYSLYDENNQKISVDNLNNPIQLWISRDTSVAIEPFRLVNMSSNLTNGSRLINGFLVNGFNLSGWNVSVHIQIKPTNKALSYLTLLKFGGNPVLQTNQNYYDMLNLFCPSDLINEQNDSFYLIFANMSTVNAYEGYVGFSIIEIDTSQLDCQTKSNNTVDRLIYLTQNRASSNQSSFTSNLWLRVYSSGCYYINAANDWTSHGMEILPDTNMTHTHCMSDHLTTFAGGFIVLPPAIHDNDFIYAWTHASFIQNPVIYSTVIALISLYVLLGICSKYMDLKDSQKVGITVLGDLNDKENKYIYEIIVYTGMRMNAGTTSKVSCVISSESTESETIELKDSRRRLFNRAGIDSFILLVGM